MAIGLETKASLASAKKATSLLGITGTPDSVRDRAFAVVVGRLTDALINEIADLKAVFIKGS